MAELIAAARRRLEGALAHPVNTYGDRWQLLVLYRDVALLEVLCGTGLRRIELCRLRVTDLDTTHGRLRVHGKGSRSHQFRERVVELPGVSGTPASVADEGGRAQGHAAHPAPHLRHPGDRERGQPEGGGADARPQPGGHHAALLHASLRPLRAGGLRRLPPLRRHASQRTASGGVAEAIAVGSRGPDRPAATGGLGGYVRVPHGGPHY